MVYTIGHSNHNIGFFISLLTKHKIELLVDVRSVPFSRRNPQFNKKTLESSLNENNIRYIDMGQFLGGRPADKSIYNENGSLNIEAIEGKEWYAHGIEKLIELSNSQRTAIMCSEEDPKKCHRGFLITNSLLKHSEDVFHIRKDNSLQKGELPARQLNLL